MFYFFSYDKSSKCLMYNIIEYETIDFLYYLKNCHKCKFLFNMKYDLILMDCDNNYDNYVWNDDSEFLCFDCFLNLVDASSIINTMHRSSIINTKHRNTKDKVYDYNIIQYIIDNKDSDCSIYKFLKPKKNNFVFKFND